MKRLITVMTILLLGGCYYEVRDAGTGRMYYTDKWVAADGYRGPLTITDETGREIRIGDAQVERLNRDDYVEALEAHRRQTGEVPP